MFYTIFLVVAALAVFGLFLLLFFGFTTSQEKSWEE